MSDVISIQAAAMASELPTRIALLTKIHGRENLVRKTGISKSQISRYGKGESQPTADKIIALAIACDVSVEWLLTGKKDGNEPDGQKEKKLNSVFDRETDSKAIIQIVVELESALQDAQKSLTPSQKGGTIAAFFNMYRLNKSSLEDVVFRQLLRTYISASGR